MAETWASHSQHPHHNAPHATKKRRTIIACLTCRKRKLRCITFEQPPTNPCQRCARLNLTCEYVSVSLADAEPSQDQIPVQAPRAGSLESTAATPTSIDFSAGHHGGNIAPPLPYTAPPPPGARPRYYGRALPPLGASGSSNPAMEFGTGHPDPQFLGLDVNTGTGQFNPADASGYPPTVGYGMQPDVHGSYPHSSGPWAPGAHGPSGSEVFEPEEEDGSGYYAYAPFFRWS
ncbi:hypothetical protein FB45DRAFT_1105764 [Roridomyces roridus]|uniref:Zn(2)-C6 fungal-type domain-containing protein n=1 Tax=Roridomyces roridus TaxID=1738132 RepID=A0AAD7FCZ4_9AGAR|nr:hypothetical protein FB45DRAFT_1105764 [Roridomyces roridus]